MLKSGSGSICGHRCPVLIQPWFCPETYPQSGASGEAELYSRPKVGPNGLRLTPFPLPVFGLSIGMRPQFAQWKKSARGFLGSISFFLRKSYKKKWFIFLTLPEYCHFGMCCLEVPQESSCCSWTTSNSFLPWGLCICYPLVLEYSFHPLLPTLFA